MPPDFTCWFIDTEDSFSSKVKENCFLDVKFGKAFLVVQIVSQVYPLHWQLFKLLVVTSHDYKIFEKEVLF